MSCSFSYKIFSYFIFEGEGIFTIDFILFRSTSIPCLNTMKPNSFFEVNPKYISLDLIEHYVPITYKIFL